MINTFGQQKESSLMLRRVESPGEIIQSVHVNTEAVGSLRQYGVEAFCVGHSVGDRTPVDIGYDCSHGEAVGAVKGRLGVHFLNNHPLTGHVEGRQQVGQRQQHQVCNHEDDKVVPDLKYQK